MTPVILLTDSYLSNGSEPWKIPSMSDMPSINVPWAVKTDTGVPPLRERPRHTLPHMGYTRYMEGLEHRIGGLEKTIRGSVSYTPENHEYMVKVREQKVEARSPKCLT